MTLHEILTRKLLMLDLNDDENPCEPRRLEGVPVPIVEEVLRQAFSWMSQRMLGEVSVDALDSDEWVSCEGCGRIGLPRFSAEDSGTNPMTLRHVASEEDGTLYFCDECAVEPGAVEPGAVEPAEDDDPRIG